MSLILGAHSTEKPNVILILADDLGYSGLNCYGGKFLETPHIDQLCKKGMKFSNGLAAYPTCKPSRAALLTGQYGSRTSVYRVVDRHTGQENQIKYLVPANKVVAHEKTMISEVFKKAGYTTAMFGKWHVSNNTDGHPREHGFDEAIASSGNHYEFKSYPQIKCAKELSSAEYFTEKANSFMAQASAAEKPFFLYMPYYLVHRPMESKKEYIEHFKKKFGPNCEDEELPILAAMTKLLDDCVGSLTAKVQELGIEENTLIIFTSDNGAFKDLYTGGLRGSKGDTYEGGMRVPYIFSWPGKIKAGSQCDDRIIGVDLFPTLVEIISGNVTQPMDGQSLLPLLKGQSNLEKRPLICYFPKYARLSKKTNKWAQSWRNVIYEGDYKLISYPEYDNYELFNLKKDKTENNNLIQTLPEKAQYLKQQLAQKLIDIQAPKLVLNPDYELK